MKINKEWKIGDKNTTIANLCDGKDYTSQCTFINCTLQSGKILKIGRLVIVQISILPTITNSWTNICKVPVNLYPLEVFDGACPLAGTEYWVYGDGSGGRDGYIQGGIVKDEIKNISSFYLSEESD